LAKIADKHQQRVGNSLWNFPVRLAVMLDRLRRSMLRTAGVNRAGTTNADCVARQGTDVGRIGACNLRVQSVAPILTAFSVVVVTTAVLYVIESYLEAQHLVIAYLFPTTLIAIRYGSSLAFLTSFASGIAAAYFLFPPKFSLYISEPLHIAELGFFMLLALLASKVVSLLTEDIPASKPEEGANNQAVTDKPFG
jgi:K+-sensing histidine kinase KdpD